MSIYYYNQYRAAFDSDVLLFQIHPSKSESRNWYFRFRTSNGKYFQRSLKTPKKDIAELEAKKLWIKISNLDREGLLFTEKAFKAVFKDFIASKQYGPSRYPRMMSVYKFIISREDCPIANVKVNQITNKVWIDYAIWRSNLYANATDEEIASHGTVRTPSIRTLHSERAIIRQVLTWAKEYKLIKVLPEMKTITNSMANFYQMNIFHGKTRGVNPPDKVWKAIMAKLYHWAHWDSILTYSNYPDKYDGELSPSKEEIDTFLSTTSGEIPLHVKEKGGSIDRRSRNAVMRFARKRLYYLIRISQATLLRPTTEIANCRWRDLQLLPSPKEEGLFIPILTTYTAKRSNDRMSTDRERIAVGTYGSAMHFLNWRRISKEYGFGKDDDYIFPTWIPYESREYGVKEPMSMAELGRTFSLTLKRWGLHKVPTGESITLYSSRHHAISSRIISGWNLLDVATAAGTSVLTISQTYAKTWSQLQADRFANTFGDKKVRISKKHREAVQRQYDLEYGSR